uniref:Uncharacterized protein n=1 Tax=Arundo donax TaxID=35708 RepID=A0A0A9G7Z2_ARUDO
MLQLSFCINPIIRSTHFWALATHHKAMKIRRVVQQRSDFLLKRVNFL